MRKRLLWLTLVLCLGGWQALPSASPADAPHPSAAEAAAGYKGYQQITRADVSVNPELAMLCVGVSQQQVEAARAKYGPHANASILIYMNDPAATAYRAGGTAYPPGSVVVKQKRLGSHRSDATGDMVSDGNDGVGGMIKRPAGYDPEHGDWEYFYFDQFTLPAASALAVQAPLKVESGRIASCVQCHQAAQRTDHVFGSWAHPGPSFAVPTPSN